MKTEYTNLYLYKSNQKYGKFYQAYASNFSTVVSDDVMVKFSAAN